LYLVAHNAWNFSGAALNERTMNIIFFGRDAMRFLAIVILFLAGCAGTAIPREKYSRLETPQETFEFAKKAIVHDDPQAFYYCLAERTRKSVSLSELKLGWALAGSFFYLFLDAKIDRVETPAPEPMFGGNPYTAKMTLESHEIKSSFLLHREENQWKIFYPSPYPLPDISQLKKRHGLPWRSELAFYRTEPEDWLEPKQIHRKVAKCPPRQPHWRLGYK
jgi:hypothetical protein